MKYFINKEKQNRIKLILFCFFIFLSTQYISSKESFTEIIKKVDWQCSESQFVYKFHNIVEPIDKETWKNENSESNFCFKDVNIGDISITNKVKSYIRVNSNNKNIFRLNFIFLYDEVEKNKYIYIENYLINELGEPSEKHILKDSHTFIWIYDHYKIEALYMDISNSYIYTLKAEPL